MALKNFKTKAMTGNSTQFTMYQDKPLQIEPIFLSRDEYTETQYPISYQ